MSEEMLIKQCSPTLAGIKTGNLFACFYNDESEMNRSLRCWNKRLTKKGLRVIPVRYRDGRALIYVYRPAKLNRDLKHDIAVKLLQERGYCIKSSEHCLIHLIKRLYDYEEFPHEIGLFLGYPPEEVHAFIENKAERCKCVGCWKVYGDVDESKKIFERFNKCTALYWEQFCKGKSIDKLAICG